ncbi:MAG TPA: potassium channel protein [Chitinophagaceae bacterium]|nr:potassium channel protein [Chitinophagaceae bacterium]
MNRSLWRLLQPFIILHCIISAGIIGYMVIEHFSFVEAIYMTTITVTTAGFTEVHTLSQAGRMFTVLLLITSWGSFAFALTRITQYIISGEINKYFKYRKLMNKIDGLNGHVIVCGYGRNGRQAAHTLKVHGEQFVVIERDEELLARNMEEHPDLLYLHGDGTDDDVLRRAGIERAKALISALPTDADNVFIVLSARSMNAGLQIISRAASNNSIPKLKKAGADSIIMPDRIGGTHMATLVSKPDVIEFIDYLSGEEGESINMESVPWSQLPDEIKNTSLREIMGWKVTGVNCIGIKSKDGKFVINPPDDIIIEDGMKVIVLGTRQQIEEMKGNIR